MVSKNKRSIVINTGAVLFLLLFIVCPANAANKIIVGYIEFPPVFSTDADGHAKGILIDLGKQLLTQSGYTYEFRSYPTKRMANYIAAGRVHLWLGLPTLSEFKGTTYIGKSTLLTIEMRAYTVTGAPPVRKKSDLNNKSVILMRGYSYGGWLDYIKDPVNHIEYSEVDTDQTAFQFLARGRHDYMLNYKMPSTLVLKTMKIDQLTYNTISTFDAKIVVSKKAPDAQNLLMKLETAFNALPAAPRKR